LRSHNTLTPHYFTNKNDMSFEAKYSSSKQNFLAPMQHHSTKVVQSNVHIDFKELRQESMPEMQDLQEGGQQARSNQNRSDYSEVQSALET
jgi:hypothetical protein